MSKLVTLLCALCALNIVMADSLQLSGRRGLRQLESDSPTDNPENLDIAQLDSTSGRHLLQANRCPDVPAGYTFYPGYNFRGGAKGICTPSGKPTKASMKTLLTKQAAACRKDRSCSAFTVLPSTGTFPQWQCRRKQMFQFFKHNVSLTNPCQGVYVKDTCGKVPNGYIFYPGYDNDASSQGCTTYASQDGWTPSSVIDSALPQYASQCTNNPNCKAFSIIPASGGNVATACTKTAPGVLGRPLKTSNRCQGVYVKANTLVSGSGTSASRTTTAVNGDTTPTPTPSPSANPASNPNPSAPVPVPSPSPSPNAPGNPPAQVNTGNGGGKGNLDTSKIYSGDITYYSGATKTMCGVWVNGDGTGNYAAISGALHNELNNPTGTWPPTWCTNVNGQKAIVTGPKGSAVVQLWDVCPECAYGSIDVTKEIFQIVVGDLVIGRTQASWHFIK